MTKRKFTPFCEFVKIDADQYSITNRNNTKKPKIFSVGQLVAANMVIIINMPLLTFSTGNTFKAKPKTF